MARNELPRFRTVTAAEDYIEQRPCAGGDCEAEAAGDPARWSKLPCKRHSSRLYDVAVRLVAMQRRGR